MPVGKKNIVQNHLTQSENYCSPYAVWHYISMPSGIYPTVSTHFLCSNPLPFLSLLLSLIPTFWLPVHHLSILLRHQGCQITVQAVLRIKLSSTHSTPTEHGQCAHKRCCGWMLLGSWDYTAWKENSLFANDHWYFSVWRQILGEVLIEIKQQHFSSYLPLSAWIFGSQIQIFKVNYNSIVSSNFNYSWYNEKKIIDI